jgi:hypothetical protein
VGLLHRWLPEREVVVVADSSYAVIELLKRVRETPGVSLITRLRLDAALDDLAPPRAPRQNGRPRKKGARRQTLQQVLKNPQTQWTSVTVSKWYGGGVREVEICTDTAVGCHTGLPPVTIRWGLIRDPQGEFEPQALVTTRLDPAPTQLLEWFVRRWTMEVTLEEARAHLGIETQRQWSDLAIGRTTPVLFGLYSLVTLPCARVTPDGGPCRAHGSAVRQGAADVLGCTRSGQTGVVERLPFSHVGVPHRDGKNPSLLVRALNRDGLLRRLIG